MQLIKSSTKINPLPVIPVEVPSLDVIKAIQPEAAQPPTEYKVAYVADKPETVQVVFAQPLTWKMSPLPKFTISMNQGIKDWTMYSRAFYNWLFSCVSCLMAVDQVEMTVCIPDQFIDDLDQREITMEKDIANMTIRIYA